MSSNEDNGNSRKALKVKIPDDMYTRLHSLKVLRGQDISATITEALEAYLEKVDPEELPEGFEVE